MRRGAGSARAFRVGSGLHLVIYTGAWGILHALTQRPGPVTGGPAAVRAGIDSIRVH